jgi:hypothetical protein
MIQELCSNAHFTAYTLYLILWALIPFQCLKCSTIDRISIPTMINALLILFYEGFIMTLLTLARCS